MTYELEKRIWTEADFNQMGWHDCNVYKIGLTDDLEFDIDYILKWNKPEIEGLPFTFWIAPSTLIFKNPRNLTFELNIALGEPIQIDDIENESTSEGLKWTIITHKGDIEFYCDGYIQYTRQEPFFEFGQAISYIERFGFHLDRTTQQDNPNRLREDLLAKRKKDFEDYENAKKRHIKRQERDTLIKLKEENKIDTKEYLIKKRELVELIESYDYWLRGTRFENWL